MKRVAPIGFDVDEPDFEYHGESNHPDRIGYQCMCGYPLYYLCPDYDAFIPRDLAEDMLDDE